MIQYQGTIIMDNDKEIIMAMGDLDNGYTYSDIEELKIHITKHANNEGLRINDMINWNFISAIDSRNSEFVPSIKGYRIKKREVTEWQNV